MRCNNFLIIAKENKFFGGNSPPSNNRRKIQMKSSSREVVKILIQLSPNVEEADKVINENYNFKTISEKLAFLRGMFDIELVSKYDAEGTSEEESAEMDYWVMLEFIIHYY